MSTNWILIALLLTGVLVGRRSEAFAQASERCSDQGSVRLINDGTIGREGRVEICLGGEWSTICDDLWDERDAAVVCRQLGFATSGAIAATRAHFGPGTGPILLDNVECTGSEERLTACPIRRFDQHNCLHSEDASVICQPSDFTCPNGAIRLAGGQSTNEGRVEICVDNQYGTICDDNWDDRDAAVVCAQMGFSRMNAIAVTRTQAYGIGIGRIYFDEVSCIGNESNITECRHAGQGVHNCGHLEDAAVLCRPNNPPSVCEDGEVRLKGGRSLADGRVEICFNDKWGTVCDDQFGSEEAAAVCRQQGFDGEGAISVGRAAYGPGVGIVFLDNLACFGNETFLRNCRHNGIGNHNCAHNEDVSVVCTSSLMQECKNGTVRLVGGRADYEGRVEVCVNNHWGTVCDDQWDASEATIVCRQLGFTNGNAIALPQAIFGSGIGIIWFDDVNCLGNETSLLNCSHRGLGISDCAHREDANVLCPVPQGEMKVCENGALRLANGGVKNEGRVELCFHNRWGTVCDDDWSVNNAKVVCRQLGFSPLGALATTSAFFGEGTGPIFLDSISCQGNESNLLQCHGGGDSKLGQHNCAHEEDAGVICAAATEYRICIDGDVRLSRGGYEREGLVEVCVNNRWGTICGDSNSEWDKNEAAVVCSQLGFDLAETRAVAVPEGGFGGGSGPIFLNGLNCVGDEENLLECASSGVALHQGCGHDNDAGVICAAIPCINNDFRLVGGSETSGRVEVCVDGVWRKVCGDSLGNQTSAKICEHIGLKAGTAMRTDLFGLGRGLGGVFSVSINNSGLVTSTPVEECSSDKTIVLFCVAKGAEEKCRPGQVRLVTESSNSSIHEGRVEICVDNQWGTICDDSWDDNSATVVCKQLGFEVGETKSFGSGTRNQPILLDDIKCTGVETNLLQCQANSAHNCDHSEDAGVICSTNSDTADGLTTDQAVAITVPIVVMTTILVTACAIIIVLIIYTKFRTVKHLDEAPIVEAEGGIISSNGLQDDSSLEKQKFEDKL